MRMAQKINRRCSTRCVVLLYLPTPHHPPPPHPTPPTTLTPMPVGVSIALPPDSAAKRYLPTALGSSTCIDGLTCHHPPDPDGIILQTWMAT